MLTAGRRRPPPLCVAIMQPHYAAAVPQVRHAQPYQTASLAGRQAQPIGTLQAGVAPSPARLPLHHHAAGAPAQAAPGRVVAAHPAHHVAAVAPQQPQPGAVVAPQAAAQAKIQPQLQQLPRFRPPAFEGENGALPCPDSPGSTPRSGRKLANSKPNVNEAKVDEKTGLFLPGSIVEYKSRSSGQWIPAKVENYDEANATYRLDVQPHANPDRVRARGSITGSASSAGVVAGGAVGREATEANGANCDGGPTVATPSKPSPGSLHGSPGNGAEATAGPPDVQALLSEVSALKMQVSLLQAENAQLHEQVASESALKERYYQDLRACHEQLQRVRGTPR